MKSSNTSSLAAILLILVSCNNKPKVLEYKIIKNFDTINIIDSRGLKQGIWLTGKDTLVYKNDTAHPVSASTIDEVIKKLNSK